MVCREYIPGLMENEMEKKVEIVVYGVNIGLGTGG